MHINVYRALAESKKQAAAEIEVIGMTTSYMSKLCAGSSQWSRTLSPRRKTILLMDEYMSEPTERLCMILFHFRAALLTGDIHQFPVAQTPPTAGQGFEPARARQGHQSPLRSHCCAGWKSDGVAYMHLQDTFRTGRPALDLLQQIWAPELDNCVSQAQGWGYRNRDPDVGDHNGPLS